MTASWLFLVLAIWGAGWTLVSYRPPHKPAPLMVVGFFAAWSTTELAPLHLIWQLAATIVLIWFGALDSWPGWIALAITLVSWFFLAGNVRGAAQTDRVFTDALRDSLGAHWDDDLDPELEAAGRRVQWGRIALPLWFTRRGVKRLKNLSYLDDGNKRHRLDIYRSVNVREGAPVLLQIHGGAWMISNKNQQGQPLMYHLAARGWVCVAINYRLSPKATWPDHIVDCKRALAWIREHIAEYGGDPDFVVVTGGSAGGHLSALMGVTANDPQWQPGFEAVDTSVKAMIPFYGVFDLTGSTDAPDDGLRGLLEKYVIKQKFDDAPAVFENGSPLFRVTPDAPPALVIHGDLDTLAPIQMARAFVAKLRATSRQPVVYVELKGAHHAFEVFNSVRTMHTIAGVDLFLAWLLNSRAGQSPAAAGPTDTGAGASERSGPKPTAPAAPQPSSQVPTTPRRS